MAHKHEIVSIGERLTVDGRRTIAMCDMGCEIHEDEIKRRLNAVECLSAEDALTTAEAIAHVAATDEEYRTPMSDQYMLKAYAEALSEKETES